MNTALFDQAFASLPAVCKSVPPDLVLMLGSGWGDCLQMDEVLARVSYADIPGFGASTVIGHAGEFILYRRCGKVVAAWCGRRHYYEGVGWEQVVMPIELSRRMGAQTVLLTNAAGGVNPALRAGDFVVLTDHINFVGQNPLIGPHNPDWGTRFPDMSEVYSHEGVELLLSAARKLKLRARRGIYLFSSGPTYETPAEVRMFGHMGADVVGMSTVPEATFAKACGFKVAALSLVTNAAAGISPEPLTHIEVVAAGEAAKPGMKALIEAFLAGL